MTIQSWPEALFRGRSTEFLRFLLIGVSSAVLTTLVYAVLVALKFHYIIASGLAWALGVAYSFVLNKRFTFRAGGDARAQAARTVLVYILQLGVTWSGLAFLVEVLKLHPYVAYLINTIPPPLISFFGLKLFAFRESSQRPASPRP